jgi:hypothetical protein
MLRASAIVLSIWGGINLFLASLILTIVIFFHGNSPLLAMMFESSEVARLDARVIASLNCLTILYNSSAAALSVLALFIIWTNLVNGRRWAFWALLTTIGLVEMLAFVASAPIGNARWQVNVALSALYVVGIALAAAPMLFASKGKPVEASPRG